MSFLPRRPWHVALGALAAGLALTPAPAIAVFGVAAGCAGAGALLRAPPLGLLAAFLVVAGATAGSGRLAHIERQASALSPGAPVAGPAVMLERPRPSRFGWSAAAKLVHGGARVLLRAGWSLRPPRDAGAGTVLTVTGSAEEPHRSPGSSLDWPAYLHRRGIWREVALDTLRPTGRRGGVAGFVDSVRRRGEAALRLPLLRGMVLGEDESIDSAVRDDFQRSGLAHVLAVSGQNVMLLFALAAPLLAAFGLSTRARLVVLLGLVALYVPLAGAGPSLQRAGVMAVAGLVAMAAGRPRSRWYALLLAATVTLAVNPLAAGDAGWQLSFAAVAGILLLGSPLRSALHALPRVLAEGTAITLAATIATAPLLAHDFGSFSLAGVGANLAALPIVAPIMWLGTLQVAGAQAGAALAPVVSVVGQLNGVLAGLLGGLAGRFADMPGTHVVLPVRTPLAVAAAYAALAAAALAIRRLARRAEPWTSTGAAEWRRLPGRMRLAVAALAASLAGVGWLWATATPAAPRELTVSFLDVGQGDATLIQDGHGTNVLFDGGPPEAHVARLLRHAGVTRLALVVATHASRDHHGGLKDVIDHFPVDALLDGGDRTGDASFNAMLADADHHGVRRIVARAGETLHAGGLTIRVLSPPPRGPGPPPEDPNPRAIAAVVSDGAFDLFLAADAESPALLGLPLPQVEAMKVSHHGSADPGLPALLARLRPQVATIEVGANNVYGHPAASSVAALRRAVPRVYRTDRDGTVTLGVAGDGMSVHTAR